MWIELQYCEHWVNVMCFFSFSPQVRYLSNKGKFHDARSEHSHQVFFLYVGPLDPNGDVMVSMPFLYQNIFIWQLKTPLFILYFWSWLLKQVQSVEVLCGLILQLPSKLHFISASTSVSKYYSYTHLVCVHLHLCTSWRLSGHLLWTVKYFFRSTELIPAAIWRI